MWGSEGALLQCGIASCRRRLLLGALYANQAATPSLWHCIILQREISLLGDVGLIFIRLLGRLLRSEFGYLETHLFLHFRIFWMLIIIRYSAITIYTGSFRTSPQGSLYVEVTEEPERTVFLRKYFKTGGGWWGDSSSGFTNQRSTLKIFVTSGMAFLRGGQSARIS